MNLPASFFSDALLRPQHSVFYEASRRLRQLFPNYHLLEVRDFSFEPVRYASYGGCELIPIEVPAGHWHAEWQDGQLLMLPDSAAMQIRWHGQEFILIRLAIDEYEYAWYLLSEDRLLIEQFVVTVCRWEAANTDSILVFRSGYFQNEPRLRESIANVSLDQVYLEDSIADLIRTRVLGFFQQREKYKKHGLTWKRGVILHGPPGNGKTRLIKALLNESRLPAIYVQSVYHEDGDRESSIRQIYEKTRELGPCFVIWEDIDSIITDELRSGFLNQLDGLQTLDGVMTVATTNHLDKLDVAIKERPSRFDLKIELPNPSLAMRQRYLEKELGVSFRDLAGRLEGYSFAALQELVTTAKVLALDELPPTEVALRCGIC